MLIKICYDDEFVMGKGAYSYKIITMTSWDIFLKWWNSSEEFIQIAEDNGNTSFLKKDRVVEILEVKK